MARNLKMYVKSSEKKYDQPLEKPSKKISKANQKSKGPWPENLILSKISNNILKFSNEISTRTQKVLQKSWPKIPTSKTKTTQASPKNLQTIQKSWPKIFLSTKSEQSFNIPKLFQSQPQIGISFQNLEQQSENLANINPQAHLSKISTTYHIASFDTLKSLKPWSEILQKSWPKITQSLNAPEKSSKPFKKSPQTTENILQI